MHLLTYLLYLTDQRRSHSSHSGGGHNGQRYYDLSFDCIPFRCQLFTYSVKISVYPRIFWGEFSIFNKTNETSSVKIWKTRHRNIRWCAAFFTVYTERWTWTSVSHVVKVTTAHKIFFKSYTAFFPSDYLRGFGLELILQEWFCISFFGYFFSCD